MTARTIALRAGSTGAIALSLISFNACQSDSPGAPSPDGGPRSSAGDGGGNAPSGGGDGITDGAPPGTGGDGSAADGGASRDGGSARAPIPSGDIPGWKLVFADDFNGTALDGSRWGAYSGQPGGDPGGWWDPSHVVVHDGLLDLQTYQDTKLNKGWVSGGVSSGKGLSQIYGKYLVRFRMDKGYGIAGVVLLWPSNEQWPPEIDFAEDDLGNRDEMTATLHYGSSNTQIQKTVRADFTQWHTMGVEWTSGNLKYTMDGADWATLANANVPDTAMELDIQAQAGTCGQQYTPCPNGTTPAQVNLQIDWVVAYAPKL